MRHDEIGWAKLDNAAKWHLFKGGRSLCCKWMYIGETSSIDAKGNEPSDTSTWNCKTCTRALRQL